MRKNHTLLGCLHGCMASVIMFVPYAMAAQPAPDAGTLLHQYEKIESAPPLRAPSPIEKPAPSVDLADETGTKVLVKGFTIESKQFSEDTLKEVVQSYIGRELTLGGLQEAATKVSEYYREHNYLARAMVPKQKVTDGIVKIVVIEGKLGKVQIDQAPDSRLDPALAEGIITSRAPIGETLRPDDLNEGVSILSEFPGVKATAALQPGDNEGETKVVVKTEDRDLISASFQVNNESSRSVGIIRGIGNVSLNDALGLGDQISILSVKTNRSNYGRFSFTAPAGTSGLTLGLNTSAMDYAVDPDFNAADQAGYSFTGGATASYPIMRQPGMNVSLTAGYDYKRLVDSVMDLNSSDKAVHVGNIGVNAVVADTLIEKATNTFSVIATAGRLDLTNNKSSWSQDDASAKTNGLYDKYTIEASRIESIDENNQLYLGTNFQLSPKNLDSSEQMSLGGPDGVRAYPTNEAMGDEGFVGHVELRHNLLDWLQVIDFYDAGWIQQHVNTWDGWNSSTAQPNDYWLQGFGAGITVKPLEMGQISLTVAHTLGTNPGRIDGKNSDGYNDKTRFWLRGNLIF